MSRPRKDLEHTLWQPLGEIVSFLRGRGIPRPLQKDAWNKHWPMPEGERALAGLPATTGNSNRVQYEKFKVKLKRRILYRIFSARASLGESFANNVYFLLMLVRFRNSLNLEITNNQPRLQNRKNTTSYSTAEKSVASY